MCQECVKIGAMTQEELDKALAAGDPSVVPIQELVGSEAADFLADLFGGKGPVKSADEKAQEILDKVVAEMFTFLEMELPATPESAAEQVSQVQRLAALAMFRMAPSSIAMALMMLAIRLRDAERGHGPEDKLADEVRVESTTNPGQYI